MNLGKAFDMASNIKKTFSVNLRALIANTKGLSAAQIARDINVNPSTITHWIQGTRWPNAKQIDRILDTYPWSAAQLFLGIDTPISEILERHNRSESPFVIVLK